MLSSKIASDLETLVNSNLDPVNFPQKRNGSIAIKDFIIEKNGDVYVISNLQGNFSHTVNHLISALTIASNLARNRDVTAKITKLDCELNKYYVDAMFYDHTIKKSKDLLFSDVRQVRLEKTMILARDIRSKINHYLMNSLRSKVNNQKTTGY